MTTMMFPTSAPGWSTRRATSHLTPCPQEDVRVHYPRRNSFVDRPLTLKQLKKIKVRGSVDPRPTHISQAPTLPLHQVHTIITIPA